MREENGGGIEPQRRAEEFADADDGGINGSPINHTLMGNFIFIIQAQHPHFFLGKGIKGRKDTGEKVGAGVMRGQELHIL
jgi:hypothetical protein